VRDLSYNVAPNASDNYIVVIEPSTTHEGSWTDWRERGELKLLGHKEEAAYPLERPPHIGGASIAATETRIMSA